MSPTFSLGPTTPHAVLGSSMLAPYPAGSEAIIVGMGCFWGAEKHMWSQPGVVTTAVGYSGGHVDNPGYQQVCSGSTGHSETVLVVFDPARTTLQQLLAQFWENHDPTQGDRQGNDVGSQYRSVIQTVHDSHLEPALLSRDQFQQRLSAASYGQITTEVAPLSAFGNATFWFAEEYHQQYLHKNPTGYCPVHATGVNFPKGT